MKDLEKQLNQEENDFKALGIENKIIRDHRGEKFEQIWLPKIKLKTDVNHDAKTGKYTFCINGAVVDFYPKANKLIVRNKNKWIKPALNWIIKQLNLNN